MIPSRAMLTTPERSDMIPPSAASVSGVAVMSVCAPKMATSTGRMLKARKRSGTRRGRLPLRDRGRLQLVAADAEQPADDLRRGDEDDDRRLDDGDQVARHLGLQLHEARPVVEGSEEQCRGKDRPRV